MSDLVGAQYDDPVYLKKGTGNTLKVSVDGTQWADLDYGQIPDGGSAGDVLSKDSTGNLVWTTPDAVTDYSLPTASTTTKGGIKVDGTKVTMNGDTLVVNHSWSYIEDKPAFATVATSGSYNDLKDKPTIPAAYSLPTASTTTKGGIKVDGTKVKVENEVLVVNPAWGDITGKPSFAAVATSGSYNDLTGTPTLAPVATSGSYNDLSDKPYIPTAGEAMPDPYAFTTTESTGTTLTLSKVALGVVHEFEYDVINSVGVNITTDSRLKRQWTADGYVLSFLGGWPAGTWKLKPTGGNVGSSGGSGIVTAGTVSVTDSGNYYASDNVETVLQEVGSDLSATQMSLQTTSGKVSALETTVGTHTTDISGLKTTTTNQGASITALGSRVDALENSDSVTKLTSRVDDLEDTVDGHTTSISGLTATTTTQGNNISSLTNRVTALESSDSVTGLTARVQAVEEAVDGITTDVSGLSTKVNGIDTTVGGHTTGINTLNTKVSALETTTGTHTTDISGLKTTVGTHTTDISGLKTTVGTHTTSINTLTSKAEATDGTLNNLTTDINSLKNTVGTHTTSISANTTDIANLKQRVTELETTLAGLEELLASI